MINGALKCFTLGNDIGDLGFFIVAPIDCKSCPAFAHV